MTAAPTLLTVGAKEYKVGPLRYLELGVIQRFLNETCPAPVPQVGDGRWTEALFATFDGVVLFLNLLFSKHQEVDADGLAAILAEVGPNQMGRLFAIAMELDPPGPKADGGESGPKAPAAPSTT